MQANQAAGGADTVILKLIEEYIYHYENLLWIIRFTTFSMSLAFIGMVLSNRTLYPRWMAAFNPILLLVLSLLMFFIVPAIGKYTLPIALNAGYFIYFTLSTLVLSRVCKKQSSALRV